jgi:PAS domain S-box-containing protein
MRVPPRPPFPVMSKPGPNSSVEQLLRQYLGQTQDPAVICIGTDERISAWLGAAQAVFGYTCEEAVGKPASLIFNAEDRQKGLDKYELAVAARDSRSEDDRWHVRKDGTRVWMTGSVEAIKDGRGQLLGFVKVIRDKTDLRSRIEALENKVQAFQASQERTHRFLSTLGHELRNPLAPLQTACHIIARLTTDPRVEKALGIISQQVAVLSRLAEDLMEVSRAGAGKLKLDLETVDLRKVLNEAVYGMRQSAAEKGVELECLLPEARLEVKLDAQRFQRVVLNLVGNAIKYTPQGGRVWVKATQEGRDVILRVEDTGIGIAPDVLPRIFDLFTQESLAADMVPSGLGIGLTIVKELVELHGGQVQARSAGTGKGAEFTVRLPAASA